MAHPLIRNRIPRTPQGYRDYGRLDVHENLIIITLLRGTKRLDQIARRTWLTKRQAEAALTRLSKPDRWLPLNCSGPAVFQGPLGLFHVSLAWALTLGLPVSYEAWHPRTPTG